MSAVAVAIVGGAVVSGVLGSNAAESAANTQASAATQASGNTLEATQESNALQYQMYLQNMQNQSPYMQSGQTALAAMMGGLGLGGNGSTNTGSGYPAPLNGTASTAGSQNSIPVNAPTGQYQQPGMAYALGANGSNGPTSPLVGAIQPAVTNAANQSTNSQNPLNGTNIPGIGLVQPVNYGASPAQTSAAAGSYANQFNQTFTPSSLTMDPSYQFRLGQGLQALQSSAAARGGLLTGQGAKDISDYAQQSAAQQYQQAYQNYQTNQNTLFNRLASVAGVGQTAVAGANTAGTTAGTGIANTTMTGTQNANNFLTSGAAAQAGGTIGAANAITGSINGLGQNYLGYQMYNNAATNAQNNAILQYA